MMANLVRRCGTALWPSIMSPNQSLINPLRNFDSAKPFSTSQVLLYKTKKRRKRYPFFWLQDKYRAYYDENLTPKNEEFFQQFLKDKYSLNESSSPLKQEPWDVDRTFTENDRRTGLLAKKLGQLPMWTKQGKRIIASCLMVSDNHVIKYHSPEEYAKIGRPVDRKRYEGLGCMVIGADSRDPRGFTAEYNGLFKESGVMPKKKLTRFFVTHNARIEPGTPLLASHFKPGMYVDIYGKSIEQGLQGVRVRHKMKGGRKTHGTTKAHNRVGSIGRGRKHCGPLKGRRMPGWHGGERVIMPGIQVLRVDTKYNLLYVNLPAIPGKFGAYVNVMDSRMPKKTLSVDTPPPFPTVSMSENSNLDQELFHEDLHKASDPTILMEVTEAERKAAALAARRDGKAKTAQKSR